jgi:hypothetical protein
MNDVQKLYNSTTILFAWLYEKMHGLLKLISKQENLTDLSHVSAQLCLVGD